MFVSARWNSRGRRGEPSVLLLYNHKVSDADSLQVRSKATVCYSHSEHTGLLMSRQAVDWVCRGVITSSGSSPLGFLTVPEQGFGFLESGGGLGCGCLLPDLARRSALSLPGIRSGLGSTAGFRKMLRSFSSWWID